MRNILEIYSETAKVEEFSQILVADYLKATSTDKTFKAILGFERSRTFFDKDVSLSVEGFINFCVISKTLKEFITRYKDKNLEDRLRGELNKCNLVLMHGATSQEFRLLGKIAKESFGLEPHIAYTHAKMMLEWIFEDSQ